MSMHSLYTLQSMYSMNTFIFAASIT